MAKVKHLEGCGMGKEEEKLTSSEERFEKAHAMVFQLHAENGRLRESIKWLRATIFAMVAVLLWGIWAQRAQGQTTCHPAEAESTYLWYVPTETNTSVQLIAYCADGGVSAWTVSFFEGDEPGLWDWWEMQDRASELLRGG